MQTNKIKRLRLNSDLRNKIASRFKVHIEAEDTQEKEKFFELRENFKDLQDKTWVLAEQCVRRAYPQEDVDTCHYLENKYPNVDTVSKATCFHFGYMATKHGNYEDENYGRNHEEQDDKATQYASLAEGQGYQPQQKLKVEPMTLKALYRERAESGQDLPSEHFNLFKGNKTKITRNK